MRGAAFAAFAVSAGVLGCAAIQGPAAPAAKPELAFDDNEIVVIGRGPEKSPGIAPEDEGTEYIIYHRTAYRCTRVKKSARNPRGLASCRAMQNGDSRNPDPGRLTRSQTQGTWR